MECIITQFIDVTKLGRSLDLLKGKKAPQRDLDKLNQSSSQGQKYKVQYGEVLDHALGTLGDE